MVKDIIFILTCILIAIFAICAFLMARAEKKERRKIQEGLEEEKRHAEQAAEIISNANRTKADARTGDHSVDIEYMANKLHDYANK